VRPEDMPQRAQSLREQDSAVPSVVGHDTGTRRGLQIAGNMDVGAQTRHLDSRHRHYMRWEYVCFEPNLVWLGRARTQKSGLVKRRKVTGTGAVWRLVGEGTAVRVQRLQDGHRSRYKGKLRCDETFRQVWGKDRVTLAGWMNYVGKFRAQFLMKCPAKGALCK
jgi:hypothetical protein